MLSQSVLYNQQTMKAKVLLNLAALIAAGASCVFGGSINSVVVYGDSLSDNGNLFALTQAVLGTGQPGAPYYMGRASNGPVTPELLASDLHVPLIDFAFDGATTGVGNILDGGSATTLGTYQLPGMLAEFNSANSQATITADAAHGLFIVWGGPNNFASLSATSTPSQVAATINTAVSNIVTIVDGLEAKGVTNILVPGMADLGAAPAYSSQGALVALEANAATNAFNLALQAALPAGVTYFNTNGVLQTILADPSAYGFSNTTDACFTGTSLCSNPNSYVFFDSEHPTTAADAILAEGFVSTVTPEPATILLVAGAFGGFVFVRRRATKA